MITTKYLTTGEKTSQAAVLEREQAFVSQRFETDDDERDSYISTKGDRMLRKLALKGISAIVVGVPSSGKSVSVELAGFDAQGYSNGEVNTFAGLNDEELEMQIIPRYPERRLKAEGEWQRNLNTNDPNRCCHCRRSCSLSAASLRSKCFEELFLAAIGRVEGHCPLRVELGIQNLINEGHPCIFDYYGNPLIPEIASQLLKNRINIILVCTPQMVAKLKTSPMIAPLTVLNFPVIDDETVALIARARGCKNQRVADLAKGNLGKLSLAISLLAEMPEAIGATPLEAGIMVEPRQLEQPKRTVKELVEDYCWSRQGMKVKPGEVSQYLYDQYGMQAEPESIGRILTKIGYKKKHTKSGAVYEI